MADSLHSALTGTDLHEPKGVVGAASGTVYTADGATSGNWTQPPVNATQWAGNANKYLAVNDAETGIQYVKPIGELQFTASSVVPQLPAGLDTPLQVEFGPAQIGTYATIDVLGNIQFLATGTYRIQTYIQWGRAGATGASQLFQRQRINGTPIGSLLSYKIDNADHQFVTFSEFNLDVIALDTLTYQITRSSSGDNSGGLYPLTDASGWGTSPSASITVYKSGAV